MNTPASAVVPSREAVEAIISGLTAMDNKFVEQGDFRSAGVCADSRFSLRTLLAEVERLNTHAERLSRINREVLAESELLSATAAQLERTVADQAAALAERDKVLRYCRNYVLGRLRNLERDPTTTRDSLSDVQSDLDAIDAALAASVSSASEEGGT